MKLVLNKMMHPVLNKPVVGHIVDTLKVSGVERIVVVVGHGAESVKEYLQDSVEYATQQPQLGTGHAVIQASVLEGLDGDTIVVNGDGPCIQEETVQKVFESSRDAVCTVLMGVLPDGECYGRVIRNAQGMVEKIVEARDCNEEELEVEEINTKIFCFSNETLFEGLKEITNSSTQQEYYLTNLMEIFNKKDLCVNVMIVGDPKGAVGVNDRVDLTKANTWMKRHVDKAHMHAGVTVIDPDNIYIDVDAMIGEDTVTYPNVHIQGKTVIGKNTVTLPDSLLRNATIGDGVTINNSKIVESDVGSHSTVGSISYLRNSTEICEDRRIGGFVEFKDSHFGDGFECAHLTYIGDFGFGKKIDVSYGVVTVSYDDKHRFRTTVHDGAFTGGNCNSIASVTIGEDALLAAGSMITDSVDDSDMGIARARQSTKKGLGTIYKDRQEKSKIVEQQETEQQFLC